MHNPIMKKKIKPTNIQNTSAKNKMHWERGTRSLAKNKPTKKIKKKNEKKYEKGVKQEINI